MTNKTQTTPEGIVLISHTLCPYVQRAAIALAEKNIPFKRVFIDLANKPDWFWAMSPLGKVPLLQHGDEVIFESAVILEYIEDITSEPLHPANPLERAKHRGLIEYGSNILNAIGGLYSAPDAEVFDAKAQELSQRFQWIEKTLSEGPYFSGADFSLVDATFGPIFRYFNLFDKIGDFGILSDKPKVTAWRTSLNARASVQDAVATEYPELLRAFVKNRGTHLSHLLASAEAPSSLTNALKQDQSAVI